MKKFTYDYYTIDLPSDVTDDKEERANLAFLQAEEITRIYAMPCEWFIVSDDGNTIIVRRKRFTHKKG